MRNKSKSVIFDSVLFFFFSILAFLVLVFWYQLRMESKDRASVDIQKQYVPFFDEPQHLDKGQASPAHRQKPEFSQQPSIQNEAYLIDTMENWGNKQLMNKPIAKKQAKRQPFRQQINFPHNNLNQKTPQNIPIPPSSKQQLIKKSTPISRAGITPDQLDFAKRLINLKNMSSQSDLAIQQKKYYEQKYNISLYPETPFCIVIPSYNNTISNRYVNNMNSILQQDYLNYHIVFFDDASEDKTGFMMEEYARQHQISKEKLKIIINSNRTMAMPNLHRAANQFCQPYEIMLIVDGDDELVGRQVLKFFNYIFHEKNVWIAYTNFVSIRGSVGYSRPYSNTIIERNSYRKSGFVISHLRAFYTKLFRLINLQDLKDDDGNWFRAANDVAMYIPMMEMTHKKISYFPQISYMYNSNTGLNNHKVKLKEQKGNEKKIKQRSPYSELQRLFTQEQQKQLQKSQDRKILIKDLSLPKPSQQVPKLGWQM